jgi:hypothetical protein
MREPGVGQCESPAWADTIGGGPSCCWSAHALRHVLHHAQRLQVGDLRRVHHLRTTWTGEYDAQVGMCMYICVCVHHLYVLDTCIWCVT